MQETGLNTYEVKAILKNGRTAIVMVEAEDKGDAKYLLHHLGRRVKSGKRSYDVERYDYRTVKKAA